MRRCFGASLPVALLGAVLLAAACSNRDKGPQPEQLAAQAAQRYYADLIDGHEEGWLDGHRGAGKMSPDYRQQLLENAKMFLDQQQRTHGGIREVLTGECRGKTFDGNPIAILTLCFADTTQEAIAVPMVLEDGEWKMR